MAAILPYLPALKALAIAGSFTNAGTMTGGYRLLPCVYPQVQKSPKDAAQQWEFMYWNMSATVPWIDLATIAAIGTIAYAEYQDNHQRAVWKIWTTGAAIMPIGWAWVRQVMNVPSYQLLSIAGSKDTPPEYQSLKVTPEGTLEIMQRFNSQMSFRMMFPWVVGGLALWASLGFQSQL